MCAVDVEGAGRREGQLAFLAREGTGSGGKEARRGRELEQEEAWRRGQTVD